MVVTSCYMVTIPGTLVYSHAGLIVQHTVYKALPLRAFLGRRYFSRPMFCLFEESTPIQQLHSVYIIPKVHVHYMTLIYSILSFLSLYSLSQMAHSW